MSWKEAAFKHAQQELPKESCGLVAIIKGEETYWPCENLAEKPGDYFVLNPDDWADCEDTGEIISLIHSHPIGGVKASENDLVSCEHLGLPWHIIDPNTKAINSFKPTGYKPNKLIGRRWIWGVQDCWTLIDDWFRIEKGIVFKRWPRPKTLKEFIDDPYFERVLTESGFRELKEEEELQYGDVLLANDNLDHVALYIGNQEILHHCIRKLSCRELYDEDLIKLTKKRYRHVEAN